MPTKPPKVDSIESMGLRAWADKNLMYDGEKFLGGYAVLARQFQLGLSDTKIGKYFGRSKQAVWYWRSRYVSENGEGE